MREIERKFIVDAKAWESVQKPVPVTIIQGYIFNSSEKTLRIRIKNNTGYLTLKGQTEGISREEFEYEIPLSDAEQIMELFTDKVLKKNRYTLRFQNHLWEVDVFHGKLEGLILAEIELTDENELFEKPSWINEEVSEDPNFFNARLIERC